MSNVHKLAETLETLASVVVESDGGERGRILQGMADAMFQQAWADDTEEKHKKSGKKGLSPLSGNEISKIAPATPESAKKAAEKLAKQFEKANGKKIEDLYADAMKADGNESGDKCEEFGHYLAMQALGHGVSWFDDHKRFPLKMVHTEFHL